MTPLYNKLARFLPRAMIPVGLVTIYAVLLVLIVTFLIPPTQFDLIYLDIGR